MLRSFFPVGPWMDGGWWDSTVIIIRMLLSTHTHKLSLPEPYHRFFSFFCHPSNPPTHKWVIHFNGFHPGIERQRVILNHGLHKHLSSSVVVDGSAGLLHVKTVSHFSGIKSYSSPSSPLLLLPISVNLVSVSDTGRQAGGGQRDSQEENEL